MYKNACIGTCLDYARLIVEKVVARLWRLSAVLCLGMLQFCSLMEMRNFALYTETIINFSVLATFKRYKLKINYFEKERIFCN